MSPGRPWARWAALAAALVFLNASLTLHNIWPTPFVTWRGQLSVELAVCLMALAAASSWNRRPLRILLAALGAIWTMLVIGRYAEVTAPALYGRDVNLYWDMQHLSGVAAMFATAAGRWIVIGIVAALALIFGLLYAVLRWAIGRLADAMAHAGERRVLTAVAAVLILGFVTERMVSPDTDVPDYFAAIPWFAPPVTENYGHQIGLVIHARAARRDASVLPPSPAMDSDFSRVKGADVVLLFVEAYGAISYDRPAFATGLAPGRARLEAAIHGTDRSVVSAFVESPTFGGNSWLAHINLLSGVEVRDPDTNALLMTQKRDTFVRAMARHGYRTVGVMPGMWGSWPEGSFYGFDEIYGGERLAYEGPKFGWWDIPDQYTLAKLDALEMHRAPRAPVFAVFPTISSHIPFIPLPPYQPDWARVLTPHPYETAELDRAFSKGADWLDLGPDYVNALTYTYDSISGYLHKEADDDLVMIVVGDHQPAAMVTGEGASWDVPVHIIARRAGVLDRLRAHGFRDGLTPQRPVLGRMHQLLPVLLDAFGEAPTHALVPAARSPSSRESSSP